MTHDKIVHKLFNDGYLFEFKEIELTVYNKTNGRITSRRDIDATRTEHVELIYSISDTGYVIKYALYYKSEYVDVDTTNIIFRIDSKDKDIKEVLDYIKELDR